ncbi:organic cation transporter protein-like [Mytilus trossulus]|uniref:organic cation transporter protein-like n=1 Tax=Mytilus trossulus TaxID=6551 RepID=UPI0030057C6B
MFGGAYTVLVYVFIGYQPPHHCSNLTQSIHTYGIPSYINESQVIVHYGQCDITVYSNGTNMTSEKWTIPCVNGYTYENTAKTFVSEWNLVCTSAGLGELTQTFLAAGQCVGAMLFASMADRFGRKPILMSSHLGLFTINTASFFIPSYTIFAISRLLLGALQQGVAIVLSTILLEMFPKQSRGTIGALLSVFWTVSVMSITAFGYGLRNYSWRYIQLAAGLISVHSLFGYWLIDESFRWLIANKKTDEAIKVAKKIARINKVNVNQVLSVISSQQPMRELAVPRSEPINEFDDVPENEPSEEIESADLIENTTDSTPSVVQQYTLLDILKSSILLRNSIILWFAWCVNSLTYYGLFLTSSSMAGSRYLNYFINATVELPSNIMFWLMVNRTSRKTLVVFFHALAGLSLIISVALLTLKDDGGKGAVVSTAFGFLGKLAISSSFNSVWLYTPELYPTNLRSAGFGVASTMARVGAMIAPFSSLLAARIIWGPGVVFGVCCFLVTILVTVLPETGQRELPQTLEELVNWNKEQSGWKLGKLRKKKKIETAKT